MKRFGTMVLLTLAVACSNPAADKPAASVSDPASPEPPAAKAPEPAPAEAASGTLAFTGQGSSIEMVGSKITGSHDVKVTDFKGDIQLAEGAAVESGTVQVVMQMATIESDHPKLTKHLLNSDFFEVDKHPTSSFKSTAIEKGGEGGASHTVSGDLTLRGVTKNIRFPATITQAGKAVTVKAEFSINRKDFGIAYAGKPDDLIRDEVLIKLNLNAS
ncbi:MAG: YceI family protein [Myxococcales bacterium]|nr:YceI family protein [Myxococcales bacterium]